MPKPKLKRLLLIDIEILLYQYLHATSIDVSFGSPDVDKEADLAACQDQLGRGLEAIRERLGGQMLICMSGPDNWRKTLCPTYKANRAKGKPPGFFKMKRWILENYNWAMEDKLEADDVMGILSTGTEEDYEYLGVEEIWPCQPVIVSTDKDMRTIPGFLADFKTKREKIEYIPHFMADWNHMFQTLKGDSTDGYPGCPRVGAVGATEILKAAEHAQETYSRNFLEVVWESILWNFENVGLRGSDAILQARLARILRSGEFDFDKGEVQLWTP